MCSFNKNSLAGFSFSNQGVNPPIAFHYNDELSEKFINLLMKHGKKAKAYILLRKALHSLYVKNSTSNMKIEKGKNLQSQLYLQPSLFSFSFFAPVSLMSKQHKGRTNGKFTKDKVLHSFPEKNSENKNNLTKLHKDLQVFPNKKIPTSLFAKKLLLLAIENVKPSIEVRKVKVAGKNYQVPSIIPKKRQQLLAMRWILDCAKQRKKKSNLNFYECLSEELFDALNKSGKARQKRDELHKLAESNRAYIRFKWW